MNYMSDERRRGTDDDDGACFVDTNILVYAFEKKRSDKTQVAQDLLRELMDSDRLRLSTQVVQELFVTLTRKSAQPCTAQEALVAIEELAAWPIMQVDLAAIRAAAKLSSRATLSFWDALVITAAERIGAKVLYSEDLNHGQTIGGVRVTNPFRLTD